MQTRADKPNDGRPYFIFRTCYVTILADRDDSDAFVLHEAWRGPLAIPRSRFFDQPRAVVRRMYADIIGVVDDYWSPMAGRFVERVTEEIECSAAALGGRGRTVTFDVRYFTAEAARFLDERALEQAARVSAAEEYGGRGTIPAAEWAIMGLEEVNVLVVEDERDEFCMICNETILRDCNQTVVRLPCSHLFHKNCITPWLRINCQCPLCRKALPSSEAIIMPNSKHLDTK